MGMYQCVHVFRCILSSLYSPMPIKYSKVGQGRAQVLDDEPVFIIGAMVRSTASICKLQLGIHVAHAGPVVPAWRFVCVWVTWVWEEHCVG